MTTVPDMQMGCDTCAFIPEERKGQESPYDADFYHYKYASAIVSRFINSINVSATTSIVFNSYSALHCFALTRLLANHAVLSTMVMWMNLV
jgi:hypothetical protein